MSTDIELLVVEERELLRAHRAAAFELFPENWKQIPCNSPERGWTQLPPAWRVLAVDSAKELVGQAGLVFVSLGDPVIGVSDVVVADHHRGQGLASEMLEMACQFADRHAHALMVDTEHAGLRRVLARKGFEPVTDQAVLVRGGERTVPSNWMYRGEISGLELGSNF